MTFVQMIDKKAKHIDSSFSYYSLAEPENKKNPKKRSISKRKGISYAFVVNNRGVEKELATNSLTIDQAKSLQQQAECLKCKSSPSKATASSIFSVLDTEYFPSSMWKK